jgi:hypothetical protein
MHPETYWRDQAMGLAALLDRTLNLLNRDAETMTVLSDALAASMQNLAAVAHAATAEIATLKADKESLAAQLAQAQQTAEDPNVMQQLANQADAISAELSSATEAQ